MKTGAIRTLTVAGVSVSLLASLAWIAPPGQFQPQMENETIRDLKKKLTRYSEHLPEDRLYLQLDKPFYEPGETIWFSAYVRDGITLKPSGKSDIVHVEFLNPKGSVEKSINLIAKNGVASGDFQLENEALGGLYKIRAYTNWMKNEGDKFFEKQIQVQEVILPNLKMKLDFERKAFGSGDEVIAKLVLNTNENKALKNHKVKFSANLAGVKILEKPGTTDEEGISFIRFTLPDNLKTNDGLLNVLIDYNGSVESISRSIPIVLNHLTFNMFPEGGDLVNGLTSRVAFKAINEFGKPADIEGVVKDSKGKEVSSFSSFHNGMGAFNFKPEKGETYAVKITKPEGLNETYSIPEPMQRGYVMETNPSQKDRLTVNLKTTETEELSVIAQVRGKIYYSTVIQSKPGENKFSFPTYNFPAGVAQITLFDSKGIPRAERLVFVNKDRKLKITMTANKEKYQPREKVKLTLNVRDERGMPVPATLSMSVVNDQLLSFADDRSGNLLSELLLQQDLKEKIEEPGFYFDPEKEKADEALDYLLMTSGWRRFTWEKISDGNLPSITHNGEKAILSGTVLDANTGKPVKGAKIKISGGAEYATDEYGKFIFNKLDLSTPVTLTYTANGYSAQSRYFNYYSQDMVVYMYNQNYYKQSRNWSRQQVPQSNSGADRALRIEDIPLAAEPMEEMMVVDKEEKQKKSAPKGKSGLKNDVSKDVEKGEAKEQNGKVKKEQSQVKVADERRLKFAADSIVVSGNSERLNFNPQQTFYRARQFPVPAYSSNENVEVRTDFRNTIYWNPMIEVDRSGKKTIEFPASDEITSFRASVEGIAIDGMPGRAEHVIYTQLPFDMKTKVPVEVATEDKISIPLTLRNNTDKPLGGALTVQAPEGVRSLSEVAVAQTIMPGKAKTIYLDYQALDKTGTGQFRIIFKACGLSDAFTQDIRIVSKGFPVTASFSGQDNEKEFSFTSRNLVKGSLKMTFTAFPNVVSDLMKGVSGILREPYGCFEQTSSSAYPNAMVLDYLNSTGSKDEKTISYARDLLNRGYKRLTTFETKGRGYEWFGADPAHEGLTAYGIMEFTDMKNAGADVDEKMLERTGEWLMNQRDGNGGFKREKHAYHDFGRVNNDILNAYIVYALTEAGYDNLRKEFDASYKKAVESKDPYMLALMAIAAHNMKETAKTDEALKMLLSKQNQDGSWTGTLHSITVSQGVSFTIETTSLSVLALLKTGKSADAMTKGVQFLVGKRSGSGVFGSTQGTILALKALTEYAKFSKKTNEDGTIQIYVNGKKAAEKSFKAGEKEAIVVDGLEEFVKGEGKHEVRVKFAGAKTPLPYSVDVRWNTTLPESQEECAIAMTTSVSAQKVNVGETVRLKTVVSNRLDKEVPSTMAIIGIPAGFTAQPWQLKELQEKHVFDYYEILGNNIAIYYRGLPSKAVKEINLDLKAEIPGEYDAPASSAYLYYTNEYKTWTGLDRITINKNTL